MVRIAFRLFCCASLVLVAVGMAYAGADDDQKIENTLKVKSALVKGAEAIKCGRYREAVHVLESQLPLVGDNRDYLNTLRDAYQGLIGELKQRNQDAEMARYQRRLNAIDPGALLESKNNGNPRPEGLNLARPAPTAVPAPTPAPTTERTAPVKEVDPFSDANSASSTQVHAMLEQADRAFAAQKYDVAAPLYDQAFRLDPSTATPAKERWAYCKLHGVVASLNRKESSVPPQEMEREVRLALSMAPKLAPYGTDLLRKIHERQGPSGPTAPGGAVASPVEESAAVEIKHLPPSQGDTWSICETGNFRIYHANQSREQVERVARAAEAARSMSARKWFGDVPATWNPRCELYLHLTREEYSKATRQPPDCPGHSTIAMSPDGARVVSRRIDLHCDDLNMVYGVLPHETTHVVLAGRFGVRDLPRWADEGMAVLSEPRDRVEKHLRNLPKHQSDRQLFRVSDLMRYNEYPKGEYIGAFYAQSVSLVDYLCHQKGPQAFSNFLRDGLRSGYETALQQHYGLTGFDDLQQGWQKATLGNGSMYVDRGK